ncbi:TPA: hypothetical protein ACVEUB_004611 [Salmonella enterica]
MNCNNHSRLIPATYIRIDAIFLLLHANASACAICGHALREPGLVICLPIAEPGFQAVTECAILQLVGSFKLRLQFCYALAGSLQLRNILSTLSDILLRQSTPGIDLLSGLLVTFLQFCYALAELDNVIGLVAP